MAGRGGDTAVSGMAGKGVHSRQHKLPAVSPVLTGSLAANQAQPQTPCVETSTELHIPSFPGNTEPWQMPRST